MAPFSFASNLPADFGAKWPDLVAFGTVPEFKKYKRFKIETLIGDLKSRGFNAHSTKVGDQERVSNRLMLACLAFILVLCFGINAPSLPFYAKFCRKDGCDCSVFTSGKRALA